MRAQTYFKTTEGWRLEKSELFSVFIFFKEGIEIFLNLKWQTKIASFLSSYFDIINGLFKDPSISEKLNKQVN